MKKTALIRRCDTCKNVTAIDLDNTLKHKREMQSYGQTVYEVTDAKAKEEWTKAKPCECEKGL